MANLYNWNNKGAGGKKEKVIGGETEELGVTIQGREDPFPLSGVPLP